MGKRDRIEKTRTRRGPPVLRPLKPRGQKASPRKACQAPKLRRGYGDGCHDGRTQRGVTEAAQKLQVRGGRAYPTCTFTEQMRAIDESRGSDPRSRRAE